MLQQRRPVPVRTIMVTIALVLATLVGLYLVFLLARIELLLLVAAFFAVVLGPPVTFFENRLHMRRGLAAGVVFLLMVAVVSAMLYAFIRPVYSQGRHFSNHFSTYVAEARAGKGPVGHVVKRYKVDQWFDKNRPRIQKTISRAGGGAVKVAASVAGGLAIGVTILVLAFLMVLHGPGLLQGALGMLSPPNRARVRAVAVDAARAMTGYVFGNLVISVIAGLVTFISLEIFRVPFAGVLGLWVGFADLIPLVGATLGAVPTVLVAFLHSVPAGIGMIVVFIVYQQFENHVLQVVIMSKTVQINQLAVLVSVLVGVELMGFVGALLAIPAAGVIQVIARDIYDHRQGAVKNEPTIGEDELSLEEAPL